MVLLLSASQYAILPPPINATNHHLIQQVKTRLTVLRLYFYEDAKPSITTTMHRNLTDLVPATATHEPAVVGQNDGAATSDRTQIEYTAWAGVQPNLPPLQLILFLSSITPWAGKTERTTEDGGLRFTKTKHSARSSHSFCYSVVV